MLRSQLTQQNFNMANTAIKQSITMPFPHGLSINWQTDEKKVASTISSPLYDWLFDNASLTKRLLKQCQSFNVHVLSPAQYDLSMSEKSMFDDDKIHCREVLLLCDNVPQVYARTLIPQTTLEHANQKLKTLKATSLGDILFSDPSMTRGHIEVCETDSLAQLSNDLLLPESNTIWGRRSMFYLQGYPLSVTEFFLPGAYAYSAPLA